MTHPQPEHHPQSEPASPQPATRARRCRHIFSAGRQCASPCLRSEQFCYFHHTTRRPVADPKARAARAGVHDLPVPEDRDSIRAAIAQVMHAIAHNNIDPRRAGLLLYSLQIALCALPKEPPMPRAQLTSPSSRAPRQTKRQHIASLRRELEAAQARFARFEATQAAAASSPSQTPVSVFQPLDSETWLSPSPQPHPETAPDTLTSLHASRDPHRNSNPSSHIPAKALVEDTVLDPAHGLIAPETFLEPEPEPEEEDEDAFEPVRQGLAYQLYETVARYEARLQGQQEGYEQARADLLKHGKLSPPETDPAPDLAPIDLNAAAEPSTHPGAPSQSLNSETWLPPARATIRVPRPGCTRTASPSWAGSHSARVRPLPSIAPGPRRAGKRCRETLSISPPPSYD